MKRILFDILLLIAFLSGNFSTASAQDIEANGIYYNIISDTQVEGVLEVSRDRGADP